VVIFFFSGKQKRERTPQGRKPWRKGIGGSKGVERGRKRVERQEDDMLKNEKSAGKGSFLFSNGERGTVTGSPRTVTKEKEKKRRCRLRT